MKINSSTKFFSGFSLLELLLVISIIGILISIAYPCYRHHVVQVRRNEAKIGLTELAAKLENYYSINNHYTDATLINLGMPGETDDHSYQFEIQKSSGTSYQIQALPLGNQITSDSGCGNLGLNELGEKTITGTSTVEDCW